MLVYAKSEGVGAVLPGPLVLMPLYAKFVVVYLEFVSFQSSWNVAIITEVLPVGFVPNSIVQRVLLRRLRLQTGGTILVCNTIVLFLL